ncbi:hypothetical protein CMO92_01255 [Candidatus Woesearchaeota archaeon]|mgnify:CR=1 FL=1|nr:hypothetical protein [Candidatus Woesearchaeota archaeon]|tara:strand:- start:261 stop:476 length:216 start_codon:yes stop_codon:yes gene_type:complete
MGFMDDSSTSTRLIVASVLIVVFLGVVATVEIIEEGYQKQEVSSTPTSRVVGNVGISVEPEGNESFESDGG